MAAVHKLKTPYVFFLFLINFLMAGTVFGHGQIEVQTLTNDNKSVDIEAAQQWLGLQQKADGRLESEHLFATAFQATAETVRLRHLTHDSNFVNTDSALGFMGLQLQSGTEILARHLIASGKGAAGTDSQIKELLLRQNRDGGFGDQLGYDSTSLDTAFALDAVHAIGTNDASVISSALAFLKAQQHTDGSFSITYAQQDSVYTTALVMQVLQRYIFAYPVSDILDSGKGFLVSQQEATGEWNSEWLTSQVLLALIPMTTDTSSVEASIDYLIHKQNADGSWANDVYSTALVLRVAHLLQTFETPADSSLAQLSGRIIDSRTLQAPKGLTITVEPGGSGVTSIQQDGSFTVSALEPGDYLFNFSAPAYLPKQGSFSLNRGQFLNTGINTLDIAPTTALIRGVIKDAATGLSVESVTIKVTNGTDIKSVKSNALGEYSLVIAPGNITIETSMTGYRSLSANADVRAGSQLDFSPSLTLATGNTDPGQIDARLVGGIIDSATGQTIQNVSIFVVGSTKTVNTDSNGRFDLSNLSAGEIAIKVTKSGYHTINFNVLLIDKVITDIGSLKLSVIETSLDPSVAIISGKVVDAQTLQVPQGITVSLEPSASEVIDIQQDGSFTINDVTAGDYQLIISAQGYFPKKVEFSSSAGQLTNAGIVKLDLAPTTALISGVISDANTGLALANATIKVTNTTGSNSVQSNTLGEYAMVISPGIANIEVSLDGYQLLLAVGDVIEGNQLQFSPSLTADADEPDNPEPDEPQDTRLIGSVIDSVTGQGLGSVSLLFPGMNKTFVTDSSGQFEASELVAGSTDMIISKEGYLAANFNLALIDKTTVNVGAIKMELVPETVEPVISGRILDLDTGLAIVGATVVVSGQSSVSDADGFYEIVGFTDLEFEIQATANGYVFSSKKITLSHVATVTIDLNLQRSSIGGITISSVETDKNKYQAYQEVLVNTTLKNDTIRERQVRLFIRVVDAAGALVDEFSAIHVHLPDVVDSENAQAEYEAAIAASIITLEAGQEVTVPAESRWYTQHYPPGNYFITVQVLDAVSSQMMSELSTPLILEETQHIPHFIVDPTPDYTLLGATKEVSLKVQLSNQSNVTTSMNFDYSFSTPDGQLLLTDNLTIKVEPDQGRIEVPLSSITHTFNKSGNYPLTLQLNDGATPTLLKGKSLFVPPAVRVDLRQSLTPKLIIPEDGQKVQFSVEIQGVDGE
ncbi:MAG: carboxypeptidase regulatory-like domain-containing protein [Colwellia sp.]